MMEHSQIKKSDKYIETYADFASFSPVVSTAQTKLFYVHFMSHKAIPSIIQQQSTPDNSGRTNYQIGSVNELREECTILMGLEQLKTLRDSINALINQVETQMAPGTQIDA